jgi:hypothetical protein
VVLTLISVPTISDVTDQTVAGGTATAAIPFTVGDIETAAAALTVTATSSNPTLIPNANITLGGSGANRTVTVTPAANQLGSGTVTLTVSDGGLTASTSFIVTVTGTAVESWRHANFGTTANSGAAGDFADPDLDGNANLLEFGTGTNPLLAGPPPGTMVKVGGVIEFTYVRNKAALGAATFAVKWTDDLAAPAAWSSMGVTEQILSDNGVLQTVKASLPAGASENRFVRLTVMQ